MVGDEGNLIPHYFCIRAATMMDSVEVQLARMDERMGMILSDLEEAKERRRDQYIWNETIKGSLSVLNGRLANVEASVSKSEPTLQDFIKIKHEVAGAGKLGRWVWAAAGAAIGVIATSRGFILHVLGYNPT